MDGNNLYTKTAHLYDLDKWQDDLLRVEVPFCLKYSIHGARDILELACGTGRVSIALAERGFNVIGLDLSESMLEQFRLRMNRLAAHVQDKLDIKHGDMADFDLGKKFPLIIVLLRSFQVLLDESDQRGCLRCVRRHLDNSGVFILSVLKGTRSMEEKWVYPEKTSWDVINEVTGERVIKSHIGKAVDVWNQLVHIEAIYRTVTPDGAISEIRDPFSLKYYLPHQLRRLLRSEGFVIEEEFGSYDERPIFEGDEQILVCRKRENAGRISGRMTWNRIKRSRFGWLAGKLRNKLQRIMGRALSR